MDRSWIPTVAGVLDILAGGLALIGFLLLVCGAFVVTHLPDADPDEFGLMIAETVLVGAAAVVLVVAILAVVGGIFALQRKRWGWALTGSIAAAFVCPPVGLPAIILTVLAEKDLRQSDH
jgi:hypothetical protein